MRLGVARITLFRAREAGRTRFFRIGTHVLYSEGKYFRVLQLCELGGRQSVDRKPAVISDGLKPVGGTLEGRTYNPDESGLTADSVLSRCSRIHLADFIRLI